MIRVYGSSDDLIEIEGDIVEEFNVLDTPVYVAVSTGTLLKVTYDNDGWGIRVLFGSGNVDYDAISESDIYTEFDGHVAWVTCGEHLAK